MTDLRALLIDEILAGGAMPFEGFVERALYDAEHGFYAVHGQAGGRRGDFVTSVEVGPLFAAVIADWLDAVWRELGEPAEFRVTEVGAGVGTLFRGINRAAPQCSTALTYTLVERSAAMRLSHDSLPSQMWRSSAAIPSQRQHVIMANELLDNLAFGIAERVVGGWAPKHVAVVGGELSLAPGAVSGELDHLDELVPHGAPGTCVPISTAAASWVDEACAHSDRVLVFDYTATTSELADRGIDGWLRTYVGHTRGGDPLRDVGRSDITHDVPFDQLPPASSHVAQHVWLRDNGLPARLDEARRIWAERGHIGDLAAMVARSALNEAQALTDPSGLGGFSVLEWRNE